MATDWAGIARTAAEKTDKEFLNKISSLTRLNDDEIGSLLKETTISKENLLSVFKELKCATKSNVKKAAAIANIDKGINVLVGIASKLL